MNQAASKPQKNLMFRVAKWLLYFAIFIAVLLAILPIGIRFGAEYALKELGAERAQIEDIDLNLFTGRFALKNLQVDYQQQTTLALDELAVDLDLSTLLNKQILVDDLVVSGLKLAVFEEQEQLVIGIPLPQSDDSNDDDTESAPSAWSFGIQRIDLNNIVINANYQQQNHTIALDKVVLGQFLLWQSEQATPLLVEAHINGAPLSIKSELAPLAETQQFDVAIDLKNLNLAPVKQFLPEDIQQFLVKASVQSKIGVSIQPNGDLHIQQDGGLAVQIDNIELADIALNARNITWQGKTQVTLPKDQQPAIQANGKVELAGVNANYSPLLLNTAFEQLTWQGKAAVNLENLDETLQVSGDIGLNQWFLHDQQMAANLAAFDQLTIQQLNLNTLNALAIQLVQLQGLQAFQSNPAALVQLGDLQVSEINLADLAQLNIDAVKLSGIGVELKLDANGKIAVLDEWLFGLNQRLEQQNSDTVTTEEPQESTAFNYQIKQILIDGTNNIHFVDGNVEPSVKHSVNLQKIALGNLDSKQPNQLTPLDIDLKLYQHGRFLVTGELAPLADLTSMNGSLNAQIQGIELPDLSAYIEKAIGYQAKQGQFNSDSRIAIKQGQLDSETKVRIQRIDLKPVNEEIIAQASKSIAMPVSTALKIITDKRNTLNLTVPVKGDLNDPDVKVSTIMSGAIRQAVKNTAVTYFKFAVQPFGAIMMVSEAISDKTLQARFEDVLFEPGTANMVEQQKGYLAKVAEMIQDKKDFSIVSCVVVTEQDFLAREKPLMLKDDEKYQWDEASKTLAEQRLEFIRSTLIDQHGLSSSQVQACKPTIGKGKPRAIMGI